MKRELTRELKHRQARVLITRPDPGATRTVNALNAHGIMATSIPLTTIQPLAYTAPVGDFDALIITSQNAVLNGGALLAQFKSKPVFTVGRRTAETMPGHQIAACAETAHDLLPLITSHAYKCLLYICGQTRRPELELGLAAAKIRVETIDVYASLQTENATDKLVAFFSKTESSIILLHAPSAAEIFASALNGQKLPETTRFLCISATVAAQLPSRWHNNVTIAEKPNEAAMTSQLDKMLAHNHMPKA